MLVRHDLVWLDPSAEIACVDMADQALVVAWLQAGHPAIVRRSEIESEDHLALGIPLPSRLARRRLALRAPHHAILRHTAPPPLAEALVCAPADWQPLLKAIADRLARIGVETKVYGSLGWQYLTKEIYLRPQSDIDLLIVPRDNFDADSALAYFEELAHQETPRLDGEIVIGRDRAVAWRELLAPSEGILVRGRMRIAIEPRVDVIASLKQKVAA